MTPLGLYKLAQASPLIIAQVALQEKDEAMFWALCGMFDGARLERMDNKEQWTPLLRTISRTYDVPAARLILELWIAECNER